MNLAYDFQLLSDRLVAMGAICSVAELQGMLCGQLSCGKKQSQDEWVTQARDFSDLSHFEMTEEQKALIAYVLKESEKALNDEHFGFQPLLPEDACPLSDRARELGAWCRGFLHGFGISGIAQEAEMPAEVVEVIRDFAKISETVKAVEEEDEGTEADWAQLVEYLRTGVFTVFAELGSGLPAVTPSPSSPSVH